MYVLGIGAANVDVHGMSRAAIVMRDSNPGHLRTSAGGVTRNVMENLARLGVDARMVSALGDDLFGHYVRSESEKAGLDMSNCLMLHDAGSSAYEEAMALKLQIVEMMERELLLETYIKSVGYTDAVVSIGMDSDNVNVFVNADELAYNDFLTVYNILTEEAGCDPANVNIMPINSES